MSDEPLDDLERELAAFRPPPLPAAVRRRIGERLGAPRWTWRRWALTLTAAAAAGLAVVFAWPKPEPLAPRPPDGLAGKPVQRDLLVPPTLADYRRAVAHSAAALDQLLSRQEPLALHAPPEELRAGRRLDGQFLDSLGER
jgi:hypothetical protein